MAIEVMKTLQICGDRGAYFQLFTFWTLDIFLYSENIAMLCLPEQHGAISHYLWTKNLWTTHILLKLCWNLILSSKL